jgi:transcriptional regulator with XRE-family HTH domain
MKKSARVKPRERKTKLQMAFGKSLRARRSEMGLSQEKLADLAGLHFTYVSSVERGERNISLENIGRLAKALDCQIRDLVASLG